MSQRFGSKGTRPKPNLRDDYFLCTRERKNSDLEVKHKHLLHTEAAKKKECEPILEDGWEERVKKISEETFIENKARRMNFDVLEQRNKQIESAVNDHGNEAKLIFNSIQFHSPK